MKAALVLEDGSVFYGKGFGYKGANLGEVVFNTSMTGYQEVLTDPSYTGQIVTMTYPLIGNYGLNNDYSESTGPKVKGFIVRESCAEPSNWKARETLNGYLQRNKIIGLAGIDTRALTKRLRTSGVMRGIIINTSGDEINISSLLQQVQNFKIQGQNYVEEVTTPEPYRIPGNGKRVIVMDFGIKHSILKRLQEAGCDLTVVPSFTPAEEIIKAEPDGIFLSNGPGDPKDVPGATQTIRELCKHFPVFGICLGQQLIAMAFGADTYKLKFGHRGANHPVKDLKTGRVYITSQNHGYAVSPELPDSLVMTHKNLNDGTVEGIAHKELPVFGVQYHPEAAPGPLDSGYLFPKFVELMESKRTGVA
ncbi:MAG: carbamoyl-phosphate synthase small subunit [Clostridia bacterium]|nr:carbamoyl-phosphate synthase small subunit [Clostridiales bacterium]MDK2985248.1 carbamoyl-phosphate synthase small subunit [Clostridia bacterium]